MPPKHSVNNKKSLQIGYIKVATYDNNQSVSVLIKLCLRLYLGAFFLLVHGYFYDGLTEKYYFHLLAREWSGEMEGGGGRVGGRGEG